MRAVPVPLCVDPTSSSVRFRATDVRWPRVVPGRGPAATQPRWPAEMAYGISAVLPSNHPWVRPVRRFHIPSACGSRQAARCAAGLRHRQMACGATSPRAPERQRAPGAGGRGGMAVGALERGPAPGAVAGSAAQQPVAARDGLLQHLRLAWPRVPGRCAQRVGTVPMLRVGRAGPFPALVLDAAGLLRPAGARAGDLATDVVGGLPGAHVRFGGLLVQRLRRWTALRDGQPGPAAELAAHPRAWMSSSVRTCWSTCPTRGPRWTASIESYGLGAVCCCRSRCRKESPADRWDRSTTGTPRWCTGDSVGT